MSVRIQTPRFEGPLDLLLSLIRQHKMDIFDINIHDITQQYMNYLQQMKQLNLDLAGEFIAMAATLIHIKSRMLLPQDETADDEDDELDPRQALVQRLLEYRKYQQAACALNQRPLLGRNTWARAVPAEASKKLQALAPEPTLAIGDEALFDLATAFAQAQKKAQPAVHRVGFNLQSIAQRVAEMKAQLVIKSKVLFSTLISKTTWAEQQGQRLITFLSLLELGKLGFVNLFQSEAFGEIYIHTKKNIDIKTEEHEFLDEEAKPQMNF